MRIVVEIRGGRSGGARFRRWRLEERREFASVQLRDREAPLVVVEEETTRGRG
jgi:hypothetical protein